MIDGRQPVLGANVWIAPSAHIIGDAHLCDDVSVWFGTVVRADNTRIIVGARTNVQDGAMLHSDPDVPLTIGEGVTIGHHAILHGCTVGANVLVGMGATILNHAVIGDDCLIGAGSLVTEGKAFPAGSLIVGTPAKVLRQLTEGEIRALARSAAGYEAKSRTYANDQSGLERIQVVLASGRTRTHNP